MGRKPNDPNRRPPTAPPRAPFKPGYMSRMNRVLAQYSEEPTNHNMYQLVVALRADLKHGALGPIQRDYLLGMVQGHLSKLDHFHPHDTVTSQVTTTHQQESTSDGIQVDPTETELLTRGPATRGGDGDDDANG